MTRENRIIIISEDYGDAVLCITNLDNHSLYNLLVQIDEDIENGVGRSTTEIVAEWVEREQHYDVPALPLDAYITELTDTQSSDIIEIKDVDTKCICYYGAYTCNVVSGRE